MAAGSQRGVFHAVGTQLLRGGREGIGIGNVAVAVDDEVKDVRLGGFIPVLAENKHIAVRVGANGQAFILIVQLGDGFEIAALGQDRHVVTRGRAN